MFRLGLSLRDEDWVHSNAQERFEVRSIMTYLDIEPLRKEAFDTMRTRILEKRVRDGC